MGQQARRMAYAMVAGKEKPCQGHSDDESSVELPPGLLEPEDSSSESDIEDSTTQEVAFAMVARKQNPHHGLPN